MLLKETKTNAAKGHLRMNFCQFPKQHFLMYLKVLLLLSSRLILRKLAYDGKYFNCDHHIFLEISSITLSLFSPQTIVWSWRNDILISLTAKVTAYKLTALDGYLAGKSNNIFPNI